MAAPSYATTGAHADMRDGTIVRGEAHSYRVVRECGIGNFAKVCECIVTDGGFHNTGISGASLQPPSPLSPRGPNQRFTYSGDKSSHSSLQQRVAVKCLKRGFEKDADFEVDILKMVNRLDPSDDFGVVKMIERFDWNGHAAISFKLYGAPLRMERLPMDLAEFEHVARDVSKALGFLHDTVHAVHTDLKPENILRRIPSSSPIAGGEDSKKMHWVVCDLGSSSFYKPSSGSHHPRVPSALDYDLITTQPYRAPEVILQTGWSYPADTWSLGCILFELRAGVRLFDAVNDEEHLDLMRQRLGPMMHADEVTRSWSAARGHGSTSRPPQHLVDILSGQRPYARARRVPSISEVLGRTDPALLALLRKLLSYDPFSRPKCSHIAEEFEAKLKPSSASQPLDTAALSGEQLRRPIQAPATRPLAAPLISPAMSSSSGMSSLAASSVEASEMGTSAASTAPSTANSSRVESPVLNRHHLEMHTIRTSASMTSFSSAVPGPAQYSRAVPTMPFAQLAAMEAHRANALPRRAPEFGKEQPPRHYDATTSGLVASSNTLADGRHPSSLSDARGSGTASQMMPMMSPALADMLSMRKLSAPTRPPIATTGFSSRQGVGMPAAGEDAMMMHQYRMQENTAPYHMRR